jgi:hypothetical protein
LVFIVVATFLMDWESRNRQRRRGGTSNRYARRWLVESLRMPVAIDHSPTGLVLMHNIL